MPQPSKNEDDLDLTLPSLDGADEDEYEDNLRSSAEDIGFGYFDDEEPVDLDTSVGLDHQFDDWEIYTFADAIENPALSTEEDANDIAYNAEVDLIAGEEEGWLDESEPFLQEEWEVDDLIDDTTREPVEDSGEEGVDEKHATSGQDDETTLPPLDCDDDFESEDDDEDDSFEVRVLEEVADPRLIESEDE